MIELVEVRLGKTTAFKICSFRVLLGF